MNNKAISNIDGQLVYLRPKSTEWEPLTEKSFLLLNPPSEINNTTLTEDDKKKLAQAKQLGTSGSQLNISSCPLVHRVPSYAFVFEFQKSVSQ